MTDRNVQVQTHTPFVNKTDFKNSKSTKISGLFEIPTSQPRKLANSTKKSWTSTSKCLQIIAKSLHPPKSSSLTQQEAVCTSQHQQPQHEPHTKHTDGTRIPDHVHPTMKNPPTSYPLRDNVPHLYVATKKEIHPPPTTLTSPHPKQQIPPKLFPLLSKRRQPNRQPLRHQHQPHPKPQKRNFSNKVTLIPKKIDTDPPKKVYLFTPLPPHPQKAHKPPSRITPLMDRFFSSDDPKLVRWESMDNPSANLRLTNTLIQQKIETGLNKRLKALKLPQLSTPFQTENEFLLHWTTLKKHAAPLARHLP